MDEIRLALRRLRSRPAAALASMLTLACAIGAAAATWSLLSATLLHPLPVSAPDELVVAGTRPTSGRNAGILYEGFLYPDFLKLRDNSTFAGVAAEWGQAPVLRTSAGGETASARVGFATANYFDLLGVRVPIGRTFQASEDRRGAAPVAILTDDYCRRMFGNCATAIGKTLIVAGKPVPIVGVAAPRFRGLDLGQAVDFYLPFHTIPDVASRFMNYLADPTNQTSPTSGVRIVGRLHPGDRIRAIGDVELTPIEASAIPAVARGGMSQFARLLGVTVALLLLIGCSTVGMLLLVRTEARRDEFALCVALGASRLRLAAGIAAEGALLSIAGAVLAVPIAGWLFSTATSFRLPGGVSIARLDLHLDPGTIAITAACALLASAIVPVVAGALALVADTTGALRSRSGVTPRVRSRGTRSALIAGQVAISLVLVAGAGLFARSLSAALQLNAGIDMTHVLSDGLYLDPYGYDVPRAGVFFDTLRERLDGNPLIASTAYTVSRGGMTGELTIDGERRKLPTTAWFTAIDPEYFQTVGMRLLAGRDFTSDDRGNAPRVAIVSASFARRLAPSGNAIGLRITMPFYRPPNPPDVMRVVGVVSDVVSNVLVLEPLDMYFPVAQVEPGSGRRLFVRAAGDVGVARLAIAAAIKSTDTTVVPPPLPALADQIGQQMAVQKFGAAVLGSLGVVALVLTTLGSYVLAESMSVLRRREMGVRAALGATRRQLGGLVVADTVRLVGTGLAVGLVLAWAGASTIRTFLFQVRPLDPWTLGGVATLILTLAIAVTVRPAVRAASVDVAELLKEQ